MSGAGSLTPASIGSTRIGWIGTGVMGASMCGYLLRHGHRVTVTTRTRGRAEQLLADGATWADTPAEVAATSDLVFSMVGFPSDVREVFASVDPKRLVVSYQVPIIDIDYAVSEVLRLADFGARSVHLPNFPSEIGLPDYHEPLYDPLWGALQETGISISSPV